MELKESMIEIHDVWVLINNTRIGLWWQHYDKKICFSWPIGRGREFFAQNEKEVKSIVMNLFKPQNH